MSSQLDSVQENVAGAVSPAQTCSKEEAAQILGVSSRALERYTAAGRVGVSYVPGKTRSVAVYERAGLERLKNELGRPLLRGEAVDPISTPTPAFPDEAEQTPTETSTTSPAAWETSTGVASSPEHWDGQRKPETSPNPDRGFEAPSEEGVSDELVAVSAPISGQGIALDALAQLVLERLLDRLQVAAPLQGIALDAAGAGASIALASVPRPIVKAPQAALGEKLLLSLPEAAALCGLSRARLKEAISEGSLIAKPIGRVWRIKRTDLDAFIRAL